MRLSAIVPVLLFPAFGVVVGAEYDNRPEMCIRDSLIPDKHGLNDVVQILLGGLTVLLVKREEDRCV